MGKQFIVEVPHPETSNYADFVVEAGRYAAAYARNWGVGDHYQALWDAQWWPGEVQAKLGPNVNQTKVRVIPYNSLKFK